MAEYIDREEVIEKIFDCTMRRYAEDTEVDTAYTQGYNDGLKKAIGKLRTEKPADVVEVVRCRECVNARDQNGSDSPTLCGGVLICEHPDAADGYNPVWPSHFCSYGEREVDDG